VRPRTIGICPGRISPVAWILVVLFLGAPVLALAQTSSAPKASDLPSPAAAAKSTDRGTETSPAVPAPAVPAPAVPIEDSRLAAPRPKFLVLRFEEDWTNFGRAYPDGAGDIWDTWKHVKISDDPVASFGLGGQVRLRHETWSDFNFGGVPGGDESFLLSRFLFHGDLRITEHFRVFAQGISALSTERDLPGGRRTLDVNELDLQNGFAEVRVPLEGGKNGVTLRAGRQELLFGKQRLVSPLDWTNTRRKFDGFTGRLALGSFDVTGFWTQFVPVSKYDFDEADAQTEFFGLYSTKKFIEQKIALDLYFFGLTRDAPAVGPGFGGSAGSEDRYTLGARASGVLSETVFDYDLEGAYQFGEVGPGDVEAFMVALELGAPFTALAWKPRPYVGFDYASGDSAPGGDVGTFNQLFPLGHLYLGFMDFVARQNVIATSAGVSVKPTDALELAVTGHYFQRAERTDALYNAGGGIARGGGLDGAREIGSELDVLVTYLFDRHTKGLFGYSHFFSGDFIEGSGTSSDMDFIYFIAEYTF
jgi:hypothetical protein